MTRKTVVIALLDKAWPPDHSFVNGMLAGEAGQQPDLQLRLCVSRNCGSDLRARAYRSAACIPRLFTRRGIGRVWNFWQVLRLIHYQASREKKRGKRVALFVRNDPIYLLAASLLRGLVDRLVFQSSFPHEEYSGHTFKRYVAKYLYRIAGGGVDIVTGVSPEGVARAALLCPSATGGPHIPLLADLPVIRHAHRRCIDPVVGPVFVYIGAHSPRRGIETVLASIVRAVAQGAVARFRFVGAAEADENRLRQVHGVNELIERDIVSLECPVPRHEIPQILAGCDVGMSLISPKPVYYESSPTKLAEYMGAGLAVLASRGIPMQERLVTESHGGQLVDWGVATIAAGFRAMCTDSAAVSAYRENAELFARRSLQYRSYLPQFRRLLGLA